MKLKKKGFEMKKSLELLRRELQNNYEKRPFIIKRELYHKEKIEEHIRECL